MRALTTWTIEKASLQRTCRKNLKTRVLYLIKYKTSAKMKMNTEMITNSSSIGVPWRKWLLKLSDFSHLRFGISMLNGLFFLTGVEKLLVNARTLQIREKREKRLLYPEPHKFPSVSHIHFNCLWIEFKVLYGMLITHPSSLSLRFFPEISLISVFHSDMPISTLMTCAQINLYLEKPYSTAPQEDLSWLSQSDIFLPVIITIQCSKLSSKKEKKTLTSLVTGES